MLIPNRWIKDLHRHAWKHGQPETVCGRGSMLKNTKAVREVLPMWLRKYEIRKLVDAGAGDLNWISHIDLGCEYVGFDIEPRHEKVQRADITVDRLPECDAILCRHVLNHLSEDDARSAVELFRRSAKYLILSTGFGEWKEPAAVGHFVDYDLELAPFNLGRPLESIADCRSRLALWIS